MLRSLAFLLGLGVLLAASAVTPPALDTRTAPERLAGFVQSASAEAATYAIDPAHTNVGFRIRHMGVAFVEGEFDTYEGTIAFDPADLAATSANVTVQATSIDTDVQRRDDHLRSADFFEVETYPTLSFASTGVEPQGDGAFLLMGDLTIKDVTRPVTFTVESAGPVDTGRGMRVGFHATTTINRRDYNIDWGGDLPNGWPAVADEVQIVLDVEGTPAE